jgi:hypothetical protein
MVLFREMQVRICLEQRVSDRNEQDHIIEKLHLYSVDNGLKVLMIVCRREQNMRKRN